MATSKLDVVKKQYNSINGLKDSLEQLEIRVKDTKNEIKMRERKLMRALIDANMVQCMRIDKRRLDRELGIGQDEAAADTADTAYTLMDWKQSFDRR